MKKNRMNKKANGVNMFGKPAEIHMVQIEDEEDLEFTIESLLGIECVSGETEYIADVTDISDEELMAMVDAILNKMMRPKKRGIFRLF